MDQQFQINKLQNVSTAKDKVIHSLTLEIPGPKEETFTSKATTHVSPQISLFFKKEKRAKQTKLRLNNHGLFKQKNLTKNYFKHMIDSLRIPPRQPVFIEDNLDKNKQRFLPESYGRRLYKYLHKLRADASVQIIFKPSETFQNVTSNISGLTKDFGANVFVLVIAGVNNKYP